MIEWALKSEGGDGSGAPCRRPLTVVVFEQIDEHWHENEVGISCHNFNRELNVNRRNAQTCVIRNR